MKSIIQTGHLYLAFSAQSTFTGGCTLIIDTPGTIEYNGFIVMEYSDLESMNIGEA